MIKVHLSRLMGEKRLKIADVERLTIERGVSLHRNGLTKLYKEETDGVKFDTLDSLCKVLDCKIEDILEYVPESDKDN